MKHPQGAIIALLVLMSWSESVFAQAQLDTTKREQGSHFFSAHELLKNLHPSYSVSYMGPYLAGGPGTYNIYLTDFASTQLYHSLRLGYQVSSEVQVGIGEDAVHNVETVINPEGRTYPTSFEQYDPYVYVNLPDHGNTGNWSVFTSASFSLPVSNASKSKSKLTNLVLSQVWSFKRAPGPWKMGFRYYLNPSIYGGPLAPGAVDRQTFYASIGHFLGYQLNADFLLSTSTHIDMEHRSPTPDGFLNLKRSLPDFWQLGLAYAPAVAPAILSLGIYVQALIWAPSLNTSIIGANLSVGI